MNRKTYIHDEPVKVGHWSDGLKKWAKAHEGLLTIVAMVIAAVALGLALAGCSSPTASEPKGQVVVNALWQVVNPSTLIGRSVARDVTGDDLQTVVDGYNATTLDDFLRIYAEGQLPDIADAPPANVYICNPVTYAVNASYTNISRQSLIDNALGWRADSAGQILFIDHVPPPPIILPPPSMFAFYAIYEVDNVTGDVVLEDHCGYNADESFTGQWITDPAQGGWASVDAYYLTILHAYQNDATVTANHVHVVTRQLYTDPTP